jgi:hypothetical protein
MAALSAYDGSGDRPNCVRKKLAPSAAKKRANESKVKAQKVNDAVEEIIAELDLILQRVADGLGISAELLALRLGLLGPKLRHRCKSTAWNGYAAEICEKHNKGVSLLWIK